jgi:glycosyltransferase involved in cell wall biosynthesis
MIEEVAAGPAVTVIVPAYNAQRHLAETLDSLLAQRGVGLSVIVVDDRSTDRTADLVHRYAAADPRIRYVATPRNCGGPAGPRNLGVNMATTEWVAFCDADDVWHPDKVRAQFACVDQTGADLVCTRIRSFRDGVRLPELPSPPLAPVQARRIGLWRMLLKNQVATSSLMCKRLMLIEAGGFNTARDMVAVEDYDLWLRVMSVRDAVLVRVEEPLVSYRVLADSLSSSKWKQALKIMRVHRSIFALKGWQAVFPLLAPFLITCYISSWLYARRQLAR